MSVKAVNQTINCAINVIVNKRCTTNRSSLFRSRTSAVIVLDNHINDPISGKLNRLCGDPYLILVLSWLKFNGIELGRVGTVRAINANNSSIDRSEIPSKISAGP